MGAQACRLQASLFRVFSYTRKAMYTTTAVPAEEHHAAPVVGAGDDA